jgi:hypothetical protein
LYQAGKIVVCFVICISFGVVAAAIQGDIDRVDYISHLSVLTPFYPPALKLPSASNERIKEALVF